MTKLQSRLLGTVGFVLLMTNMGLAQEARPGTGAQATDSTTIESVVVTSTRRDENAQHVPISVSVVDGDEIGKSNLNGLEDITTLVPSFTFRQAASNKDEGLIIRGLGTISTSPGVEPTVSTVIDGVVYARQGQATLDLLNLEQVEVLRGPQGTLFGKNASAGALNITTKNPSQAFNAYADVGYFGGGNEERLKAGVSGPITNSVSGMIDILAANYDGNVTNVFNNTTVNGYDKLGAHAKLLWQASDALSFQLAMDYMYTNTNVPTGVPTTNTLTAYPTNVVTTSAAFATALSPLVLGPDNRQINSNYNTNAFDNNGGISLQADYSFNGYKLTSITAFRQWANVQHQDQSRVPAVSAAIPLQHDTGYLDFNQVSQEVRLASPTGGFFDYVVGGYFLTDTDSENYSRNTTTLSGTTINQFTGTAVYGTNASNYAVFGEGHLNFTDNFRAIIGGRLIHDDLSYNFNRVSSSAVPVTGIQAAFTSFGSTHPTGYSDRLGLQYDIDPAAMAYFTFSRGYKGPAYNVAFSMLPQDTLVVKPETSNAFELGVKTHMFDDSVQLNLDGFLDTVRNYQVNFSDILNGSPITRFINAGQVSTRGIEADGEWKPLAGLTLNGSMAFVDAHIDSFTCPAGAAVSCNINGKVLPFAPHWKTSVGGKYDTSVWETMTLTLATDFNWQSREQDSVNQTPDTVEHAYGIWNARIALADVSGWYGAFLVKNITNQHYDNILTRLSLGDARYVPRDDTRYVGINLRKDF